MAEPSDKKLYEIAKQVIYEKYPKHSAYRSGMVVKLYKKCFEDKYPGKSPYIGEKKEKEGLARWFKEEWKNQRGEVGYKYKSDVYRPTKRITKKSPKTFSELSKKSIKKARSIKAKGKRAIFE